MAVIGLILGFLGPFETYVMPTGLRLIYWVGFILVGYAIYRPMTICAGWLSDSLGVSHWVSALFTTAIAGLLLTFLIGFAISGMRFDPEFMGNRFLLLYFQCALIGYGIYALMRVLFPPDIDPLLETTAAPAEQHTIISAEASIEAIYTRLHDRLPTGFPATIFALCVEDHYVRVHTAERSEMLLLRLKDAMAEMEPIEGMQVHRGWWVAKDAINQAKRDGRNLQLHLSNGLILPVSRSYVGKLKQTGWIS